MSTSPARRVAQLTTLAILTESFRRSLLAENKAPRTIQTYTQALALFGGFLRERGLPLDVSAMGAEHVKAFMADLLAKHKPATAANRYRSLQAFFKWAVEDEEIIPASPMATMKPPAVPEVPPDVLTGDQLRRLLKACDGKAFEERRDTAMLRLLIDTGMRREECAGLKVEDVDFDRNVASVLGKGRRPRACPFGRKSALALDRYLRVRTQHRDAEEPALWLGRRGDGQRHLSDPARASRAGGAGSDPPAPVPAHLRPRVAGRGRRGGRSDATRWLA